MDNTLFKKIATKLSDFDFESLCAYSFDHMRKKAMARDEDIVPVICDELRKAEIVARVEPDGIYIVNVKKAEEILHNKVWLDNKVIARMAIKTPVEKTDLVKNSYGFPEIGETVITPSQSTAMVTRINMNTEEVTVKDDSGKENIYLLDNINRIASRETLEAFIKQAQTNNKKPTFSRSMCKHQVTIGEKGSEGVSGIIGRIYCSLWKTQVENVVQIGGNCVPTRFLGQGMPDSGENQWGLKGSEEGHPSGSIKKASLEIEAGYIEDTLKPWFLEQVEKVKPDIDKMKQIGQAFYHKIEDTMQKAGRKRNEIIAYLENWGKYIAQTIGVPKMAFGNIRDDQRIKNAIMVILMKKVCSPSLQYKKAEPEKDQLKKGIEVEKEHRDLYEFFVDFLKKNKLEMPLTEDEFFGKIAQEHLKEMAGYYTLLAEMESQAKKNKVNKEPEPEKKPEPIQEKKSSFFQRANARETARPSFKTASVRDIQKLGQSTIQATVDEIVEQWANTFDIENPMDFLRQELQKPRYDKLFRTPDEKKLIMDLAFERIEELDMEYASMQSIIKTANLQKVASAIEDASTEFQSQIQEAREDKTKAQKVFENFINKVTQILKGAGRYTKEVIQRFTDWASQVSGGLKFSTTVAGIKSRIRTADLETAWQGSKATFVSEIGEYGEVPYSELALHTKDAGKMVKRYSLFEKDGRVEWVQVETEDGKVLDGLPDEVLPIEIKRQHKIADLNDNAYKQVLADLKSKLAKRQLGKVEISDPVWAKQLVADGIPKKYFDKYALGVIEEGFELMVCPYCNQDIEVEIASEYNPKTGENFSWLQPRNQKCSQCGEKLVDSDYQNYLETLLAGDKNKIKTAGGLNREEWEAIKDAVDDVAEYYSKITGHEGWQIIDPHGQFYQDIVNDGIEAIHDYLQKNYPDVFNNENWLEEFYYKLDDALMFLYADEAMAKHMKSHPEEFDESGFLKETANSKKTIKTSENINYDPKQNGSFYKRDFDWQNINYDRDKAKQTKTRRYDVQSQPESSNEGYNQTNTFGGGDKVVSGPVASLKKAERRLRLWIEEDKDGFYVVAEDGTMPYEGRHCKTYEECEDDINASYNNIEAWDLQIHDEETDHPFYSILIDEDKQASLKKAEGEARYRSNEDIAKEFEDYIVKDIVISKKTGFKRNGYVYSGWIEIEFPRGGEHVGGGATEIVDQWIMHENGKMAFDNWYPDNVYFDLVSRIKNIIKSSDLESPEDKTDRMMKAVQVSASLKKESLWKDKLQNVYSNYEEWEDYSQVYSLAERLGFASDKEAWDANPMIQGSTNPEDYKIVEEEKHNENH